MPGSGLHRVALPRGAHTSIRIYGVYAMFPVARTSSIGGITLVRMGTALLAALPQTHPVKFKCDLAAQQLSLLPAKPPLLRVGLARILFHDTRLLSEGPRSAKLWQALVASYTARARVNGSRSSLWVHRCHHLYVFYLTSWLHTSKQCGTISPH